LAAAVEKIVETLGRGPINRWFDGGGLGPSGWVWLGPMGHRSAASYLALLSVTQCSNWHKMISPEPVVTKGHSSDPPVSFIAGPLVSDPK
jgi:hypothetical protein